MKAIYTIIKNTIQYFEDCGYTVVGISTRDNPFTTTDIEYDLIVEKNSKSINDILNDIERIGMMDFMIVSNGKEWNITVYGIRPDTRCY